ncbi:helix-turn-helix domain-containing protein [Culicoidibacter larvae]|uniref:Helix-turn-helix transcriptional regulator n=1 Tax=Culicoidibacter larvae TaxID=2579976 RepID=A0A5R8Q6P9_9FIRM|nr:helix-turn-helix transcriptional regulator [Culicoidibacter larvae]TLG70296.1 helix-turn-helix transcriptional regulator [Culicoidibacter larvae]
MMNTFSRRFEMLCKKHNIKPTSLSFSDEIGINKSTINNYSTGTSPTAENIVKISKYFNVSSDYLLGLTNLPDRIDNFVSSNMELDITNLTENQLAEVQNYINYLKNNNSDK